jgi:hypothetical protein
MSRTEGPGPERQSLIDIAVESWRFARLFARVITKLDAGDQGRYESQLRWYLKRLEENLQSSGLRVVNIEGQPFDPGIAATALNAADFGPEDTLCIDQMLEPIIMSPSGLLRSGTVLLRKVQP